ncbi:MAG TPA: PKD domain-containing protein [Chitinophagaceae bacterium]|nr:PKD domain-containing protein [Chitinophagaceae bacterium]
MKRKTQILFFTASLLLTGWLEGYCQNITNKGRDFWVGYGHHQFMEPGQSNGQDMILYFSAEQAANVVVTVQGRTAVQTLNYAVPANTVISSAVMPKAGPNDCRLYDVPPTFGGNGGEGLFGMSIHIVSDVPIVAYAHIFGSVSSGATMLMPVESWGYSYMSINSQQIDAGGPGFSWVYAIAQHDNTVIQVTPSVTTRLGKPAGVPFNITLQRGQIYQFIGQSDAGGNGNQFTGSTVKSIANAAGDCYPIAVFSGSSRTKGEQVPCGSSSGRDNDMQQCFPTQAWGKRYLTAPFSTSSGPSTAVILNASTFQTSVYKVAVKDPTTVVRRNGIILTGLINNSYYQFSSNTADYIESDKPIMVAQFMSGAAGCNSGTWGDPEMVFLSPVEQAIKRVGFYRNTRQSIYANYVTVIIPTAGVSSLRIDGSATFNHTYTHPNLPGYSIVVKGWQAAQAQCQMYSDSAFTAITYGLGSAESYAYNAGTYLNNLNAISHTQNTPDPTVPQHPYTCVGTPIKLSVLMAYQPTRLDWFLSQLGANIIPNTDIIDNAPVSSGTVVVNGITYYKYTLPGTYIFNAADTFDLPVNGYHPSIENCYNRENLTISFIVKPKPLADFTFSHTGCTLDPVNFSGVASTSNGYTIRDYNWTFPGPATATGQNVIRILPPGIHDINLSVVSNEGCASDTMKRITIYDKPPGDFMVTPANLCEGSQFTITDTSSAAIAVNEWYWDFGNGVTQVVTNGPSVTYTYPAFGTYTIKHVARSSASCVSDTVSRVVTVYAKPAVSFTNDAAGCLSPAGLVQFTGTATTPDGQTISTYAWNFGDPNTTPGNPNTSVLQNPTHNYQQGTYTINFSATTANGCTENTTQTFTFNLKPALTYPLLNAVCENAPAYSIANATVTNGVTGTGIYEGPGTTAAGLFTPAAAGYGTHTIWYKLTSGAGCIDSVSQTILVHARPRTNFTIPASGCLPANGQVQFTNSSTIPDAQTMTWLWNFGDPNATPGNPNTSTAQNPAHNYLEGTYTINLLATSANGCVKDTNITTSFAVTPLLSYAALPAVCENAAAVSVATANVTNGVAGTGVYSGPGTDAAGMFNPAIAGYGIHTITYTFTSTGGCVQTTTQNIQVHARPRTSFTLPVAGCLPTTGQVQFTNTSTIPDAQTMTWLWNFNDPNAGGANPNTSTAQNPTHNYLEGTYTINLQATSSNGCVKDTNITTTFAVTPALSFPALTNVCQNPGAAPSSIASASATNGVTGTGVYIGPGVNAAGLFDPNVAGPGVHTITYTFTTAGGCTGTVNNTIEVYPRPTASFTASGNNGACLGQAVTFTNTSAVPSGTITTWNWNLGDGNTPSYTNGNPFTVNYTSANTYNVQLVTVSDRGCFSEPVSQTIRISPLPVADFTVPTGICMPGGTAAFTNLTAVADNSALTHVWNFGDGNTSTLTNPSHVYAASGNYNVTLVSTSAFGCVQQVTKPMNSFFDKPLASFSVSPQELCQGADNVFTDGSSAPNSTIQSWAWNFADGGTSSASNPTKRFNTPGVYNVRLTVTNAVGCVSEPFVLPVTVHLQPVIDAGQSYVLPQGTVLQLNATANSSNLVFNWSPGFGLSSTSILNPTLTALQDQVYTLTATGDFGCTATDQMTVKILKQVKVPNVFSPNGDNIHDQWMIPNLGDYPGCTVEVFNRYGQQVYFSPGYGNPWNGTYKGKELPAGTYYYIIQLQNGFKPLSGSVTIIR